MWSNACCTFGCARSTYDVNPWCETKVGNNQLHFGTCPINETHYYLMEWCLILPSSMCSEVEWARSIIVKQTCKILNCTLIGLTKQITLDLKMVTNHPRKKKNMTAVSKLLTYFLLKKFLPTSKIRTLKC